MIKLKRALFFVTLLVLLSPTDGASAHGNAQSFEKNIGPYFIDIGYTERAAAGSPIQLDFELYTNSTTTRSKVLFSDIWVRVEKDGKTMFATGVHRPQFGKTGLLYVPQTGGVYTIHFRFEDAELSLAESSFNIDVETEKSNSKASVNMVLLGSGITAILLLALRRM